jgi:hypothetical protein
MPAHPCGLLEPCAATSGKHGSEEGGVGKRHPPSDKAAGTFKGTYGHHPLTSWCDNAQESLTVKLRPGNAGSDTAADHIKVLDAAIGQIPPKHRRNLLITCHGTGSTLD